MIDLDRFSSPIDLNNVLERHYILVSLYDNGLWKMVGIILYYVRYAYGRNKKGEIVRLVSVQKKRD